MVAYQRLNAVMLNIPDSRLSGIKGLKPACSKKDQPFLKTTGNVTQTIKQDNAETILRPWKHGRTPEAS